MEYIFGFYNGNLLSLHTVDNFHRAHPIHPYNHLCHRKTTIREYICNLHARGIYANLNTKNKNSWNYNMSKEFLSFSKILWNCRELHSGLLQFHEFSLELYSMPTCCAVFISANVGRLVTVVTTVIIEIAFPQNWDTFAVVAGEFRFRITRTIFWNVNDQLIKNWKIKVILKIEAVRSNMIKKTDNSNIYMLKCWVDLKVRVIIDFFLFGIKIENNFQYEYR